MIQFNYVNDQNISQERKGQAKQGFIDLLKDMAEEFDERNGQVTIDFAITEINDTRFYSFTFSDYPVHEFIHRWKVKYESQEGGRSL